MLPKHPLLFVSGLVLGALTMTACKTTGMAGESEAKGDELAASSFDAQAYCDQVGKQAAAQYVLPFKKKQAYDAAYAQCMAQYGGDQGGQGGDGTNELVLVRNRTKKSAESLRRHLERLPYEVLASARCIAEVARDEIGWGLGGGELGGGLVSCRTQSGEWSAPSYLSLAGITIGPSVGFMAQDTTFVFGAQDANKILGTQFKFDAGVYAIAGSADVEASADTDGCFTLKIFNEHQRHCTLAVSDEIGLAAGANVKGVLLRHMNGLLGGGNTGRNKRVYGAGVSTSYILSLPGSQAPDVTQSWVEALPQ